MMAIKYLGRVAVTSFVYGAVAMTGMIVVEEAYKVIKDARIKRKVDEIIMNAEKAKKELEEKSKKKLFKRG